MYNAEDYIGICLDSLLNQNLKIDSYQIIVVNDGSKDNSKAIVEGYAKKYSNIILYNQNNSGNGAARNKGMELVKGKYLYFLDADDYIASAVLDALVSVLEKKNLDILGFNSINTRSSHLNTSKTALNIRALEDYKVKTGIKFIAEHNYRAEVWWYIMKTDFFRSTGVVFYDRKFVQDSYITPTIFLKAERVLFIPHDVHRYRQNDDSITHIKAPAHIRKHMNDLIFAVKKLDTLIHSVNDEPCENRLKNRQQGYVFSFLIRFAKSDMSFRALRSILSELKAIEAYPIRHFIGKDYHGFKYRVLVFVLNRSFLRAIFLYTYRFAYQQINKNDRP